MPESLKLDAAFLSETGRKSEGINEDCAGLKIPEDAFLRRNKGAALVVADGVSSAEAGQEASRTCVERFLEEYYKTPDTWSVSQSGEKILSTINLRLYRKSHDFSSENKGFLSTFSAVVLKGRSAHFFHIGDSRIYLLRRHSEAEPELRCLSSDHTAHISDEKSYLSRAIGMDNHLPLDYGQQDLQEGDRLLLTSDGVHDFLSREALADILGAEASAESVARRLLDEALNHGSDDNISAVVALIESLPSENLNDYSLKLTRLPFPPELEPGMKLDGYLVEKELFSSSRSQLYRVRDLDSDQVLAMKTPSRNFEDDLSYIDRFIQEEWIGSRISSPNVVRVMRQQRPRSALYYLMDYVEGVGLDAWIEAHQPPSPRRAISIVKQVVNGLQAFHDNEAIHQDLKPANILICDPESEQPRAVIVDFGSVYVAGLAELQRPLEHEGALGTVTYADPMYMLGKHPGIAGDVYALATITYELFTGALPYGDKVENCRSAWDYDRLRYIRASELNPVIPVWFDGALEKGVNFDLEQRYATIGDLLKDLTQPNPGFLREDPVAERNVSTELFWKLISGFWFLTLVLVIFLFYQVN